MLNTLIPSFALSIEWTPCTSRDGDQVLDVGYWPASHSPLTDNFNALLHQISKEPFMRDMNFQFRVRQMQVEYAEIRRWESGLDIGLPFPMFAARSLWNFMTENRLHCHGNELSLAKALARIEEVDAAPWHQPGDDFQVENEERQPNNDISIDSQDLGYMDTAPYIGYLGSDPNLQDPAEISDSEEDPPDRSFQYLSFGIARQLSLLIHIYCDELEQYRKNIMSTGEWEETPDMVFDIAGRMKHWRDLYYWLEEYMKGLRGFRKDIETLRYRTVSDAEIKRLVDGKGLTKNWAKELVKCLGKACSSP
ncbi:hypothetical protein ABW20_dc0110606 [Dactylellina cionopaga]|nr:hypothetical protein ABW20_dc0110606 [Dactylellina cionopaga]